MQVNLVNLEVMALQAHLPLETLQLRLASSCSILAKCWKKLGTLGLFLTLLSNNLVSLSEIVIKNQYSVNLC